MKKLSNPKRRTAHTMRCRASANAAKTPAQRTGNRTIMLASGKIVLDLQGEAREKMTLPELLEAYKEKAGKVLDNDRMLLSEE